MPLGEGVVRAHQNHHAIEEVFVLGPQVNAYPVGNIVGFPDIGEQAVHLVGMGAKQDIDAGLGCFGLAQQVRQQPPRRRQGLAVPVADIGDDDAMGTPSDRNSLTVRSTGRGLFATSEVLMTAIKPEPGEQIPI